MHTVRHPRGVTLIELLVAITLLLVVIAIGAITARRTLSIQARTALLDSRASAMSDALRTLARHTADADPRANDIRGARDSILDILHPIGITSVCRATADTVLVAAPADSLPWTTVLPRGITTDDRLRFWNDHDHTWMERGIRAVAAATSSCGDSASFVGNASQRLVLSDTISSIRPGTIIRVLQRERWSLIRGGDGAWALAMATYDAARNAFNTPQPLVAPLAPPTAPGGPGFTIRALGFSRLPLADSALASTRTIIAVLRAPPHARYGAPTDSVLINVGQH